MSELIETNIRRWVLMAPGDAGQAYDVAVNVEDGSRLVTLRVQGLSARLSHKQCTELGQLLARLGEGKPAAPPKREEWREDVDKLVCFVNGERVASIEASDVTDGAFAQIEIGGQPWAHLNSEAEAKAWVSWRLSVPS